jgi:hypothetical protein
VAAASCDFVVDLDLHGQSEHRFAADAEAWEVVAREPFLDAARSPSALFRAFYVPVLSPRKVRFVDCNSNGALPALYRLSNGSTTALLKVRFADYVVVRSKTKQLGQLGQGGEEESLQESPQ